MIDLTKIVFKVRCGDNAGTAFLIAKNLALTVFHVVEDYKTNDIVISDGRNDICKAQLSDKINECYKALDVALLELELEAELAYENKIDFVDFALITKGTRWYSRGFPASKNRGGDNLLEKEANLINQQLTYLINGKVDIELEHEQKLQSYSGYSGAPLLINNAIVGIINSELTEQGSSKELNALSIKHFKSLLIESNIGVLEDETGPIMPLHCALKVQSAVKLLTLHIGVGELRFGRSPFDKSYETNRWLIENRQSDVLFEPMVSNTQVSHVILNEDLAAKEYKHNSDFGRTHFSIVFQEREWRLIHIASSNFYDESSIEDVNYQKYDNDKWSPIKQADGEIIDQNNPLQLAQQYIQLKHGDFLRIRNQFDVLFHLDVNVLHIHGIGKDNPMGWSVIFPSPGSMVSVMPDEWVRFHANGQRVLPKDSIVYQPNEKSKAIVFDRASYCLEQHGERIDLTKVAATFELR